MYEMQYIKCWRPSLILAYNGQEYLQFYFFPCIFSRLSLVLCNNHNVNPLK